MKSNVARVDPRGFLDIPDGFELVLDGADSLPASVHVFGRFEVCALNAALATRRALLVRGEPGTGKSQLARAAAAALGRDFVHQSVDGRTDEHDLLWTLDAVARLAEAQVRGQGADPVGDRLAPRNFIQPGALWWALDPMGAWQQAAVGGRGACFVSERNAPHFSGGVVALIDEIDKADPAVPNALLDALGHGGFNVRGIGRVVARPGSPPPLVVVTTNEERSLPDAFLRRCLVLHLEVPEALEELVELLVRRGRVHQRRAHDDLLRRAARRVAMDRSAARERGQSPPGLAEYLDLLAAVLAQADEVKAQLALLDDVARYALEKHRVGRPR